MNLWIKVAIWFVCFMFLVDWSFELITMKSTIANLVNMKALDKWDGKTPVVSGGSGTFIYASNFVK